MLFIHLKALYIKTFLIKVSTPCILRCKYGLGKHEIENRKSFLSCSWCTNKKSPAAVEQQGFDLRIEPF